MAYELQIIEKPAYLHFIVTGQNSKDTILGYVLEIHHECTVRNCFRVLIEERLSGPRLSIIDVFELVLNGTDKYRGIFEAIAYVDVNAVNDSMKFAEDACVNRALPIAVFSNVSDAEQWLTNK
jgi:hypothetical protein